MTKTEYNPIKVREPSVPPIGLVEVLGDLQFTGSLTPFGPNSFYGNVQRMVQKYTHPDTGKTISLREPRTAESLKVLGFNFEGRTRQLIAHPSWVQLGRIIKWEDGIYINPQDAIELKNVLYINEEALRNLRDNARLVGGIRLGPNNFAFVPYESFTPGVQEPEEFINGGLARGLAYSEGTPHELGEIFSSHNYPRGISVFDLDHPHKRPVLKIASLVSSSERGGEKLILSGAWGEDDRNGYAFGILNTAD